MDCYPYLVERPTIPRLKRFDTLSSSLQAELNAAKFRETFYDTVFFLCNGNRLIQCKPQAEPKITERSIKGLRSIWLSNIRIVKQFDVKFLIQHIIYTWP